MAETTGTVSFVKVNATDAGNFALVEILDASTVPPMPEIFFIWFGAADRIIPTGPQWMWRALQVSLLRDALTSGKGATLFHGDTSSFVTSVQINA